MRRPLTLMTLALAVGMAACGTRMNMATIRADAGLAPAGSPDGAAPANAPLESSRAGSAGGPSSGAASGSPVTAGAGVGGAASPIVGGASSTAPAGDARPAPASGSGPGAPSAAAAATGTPILIGQVGTFSGLAGGPQIAGQQMLQVWARWTNAHGGINGHPVQVYSADDGGDANKSASLVQDMVESKHVVAFVGQFIPLTFAATKDYVQAHEVPVVGGDDVNADWFENSMFFPQGTFIDDATEGTIHAAVQQGHRKLAILYCIESSACTNLYNYAEHGGAAKAGASVVYTSQISLGTLNFQAQCQQAQNAHADVMFVGADGPTVSRVARDCSQIGYDPQYLSNALAVSNAQAQDPNLRGLTAASSQFPWFDAATPEEQAYQQAIRTYAPGLEPAGSAAAAWASAELFKLAASKIPAGQPVNSAAVLNALWSLGTTTDGGLSPPLTFVRGQPPVEAKCYFIVQIAGGKWTAPNGDTTECAP